jgi:hypothetical protein
MYTITGSGGQFSPLLSPIPSFCGTPPPVPVRIKVRPDRKNPAPIMINSKPVKPDECIVTLMPLSEIWDESGTIPGERVRYVNEKLIRELVFTSEVTFIVADPGKKLRWIPTGERFNFWKTVRQQIADPTKAIYLERFPNRMAFVASEWRGRSGECLILLETHH